MPGAHAGRETFLALSSEITGYSEIALEGTGLVDEYQQLLEQAIGPDVTAQLYATARLVLKHRSEAARRRAMRIDILPSTVLWPVVSNLILLWYTGVWNQKVVSAQSYAQQLSYRTAGAHPPGANPTGHGSWSLPPVFTDDEPAPRAPKAAR